MASIEEGGAFWAPGGSLSGIAGGGGAGCAHKGAEMNVALNANQLIIVRIGISLI
jgi:hypothetical protein